MFKYVYYFMSYYMPYYIFFSCFQTILLMFGFNVLSHLKSIQFGCLSLFVTVLLAFRGGCLVERVCLCLFFWVESNEEDRWRRKTRRKYFAAFLFPFLSLLYLSYLSPFLQTGSFLFGLSPFLLFGSGNSYFPSIFPHSFWKLFCKLRWWFARRRPGGDVKVCSCTSRTPLRRSSVQIFEFLEVKIGE